MKLKIAFLLLLATQLAACGLDQTNGQVGESTVEKPPEPQVVTVVVVATPTAEPETTQTTTPIPEDTPIESTATKSVDTSQETTVEATDASTPQPNPPTGQWQKIPDLPRYINDLVADPQNSQFLYAGTGSSGSGSGVYKSEDGGLNWQIAADGLPSEDVMALAISASQPTSLYALVGVQGDVYISSDHAQSWEYLGDSKLFGGFEHWMQVDPANNNIIFALAKSDELTRSSDGGFTWVPLGEGLPKDEYSLHVLSLAITPSDSNIIYAGTGGFVGGGHGVYKSTDGGQTWTAVNQGMLDYRISALAVDPTSPQTVYAGADDGTFFKTLDGGQTWENLTAKLPLPQDNHPTIQTIILDASGTLLLLTERDGLFVSYDGGQMWQNMGNPGDSDSSFSTMALVSRSDMIVIIGGQRSNGGWRYSAASN